MTTTQKFPSLHAVGQPLDLEQVGRLEKGLEPLLLHVDLAQVDKLEDGLEVVEGHVLEDEDGVLPEADAAEEVLEVAAARAQHHLHARGDIKTSIYFHSRFFHSL